MKESTRLNWQAFFEGMASIFSPWGFNFTTKSSRQQQMEEDLEKMLKTPRGGFKQDAQNIRNDWKNIGNDLRKAEEKYRNEHLRK